MDSTGWEMEKNIKEIRRDQFTLFKKDMKGQWWARRKQVGTFFMANYKDVGVWELSFPIFQEADTKMELEGQRFLREMPVK